jgi:hypothetical protein
MGMDVYGLAPKNKCGAYFGISARAWYPLAIYLAEIAPEITCKCKHWYTNDGDGLDGECSLLLADILQKEIDSGRIDDARLWKPDNVSMPNEPCWLSEGSPERAAEHLQEFMYFLRYCGGFGIC